jgi:hypothetical protein
MITKNELEEMIVHAIWTNPAEFITDDDELNDMLEKLNIENIIIAFPVIRYN